MRWSRPVINYGQTNHLPCSILHAVICSDADLCCRLVSLLEEAMNRCFLSGRWYSAPLDRIKGACKRNVEQEQRKETLSMGTCLSTVFSLGNRCLPVFRRLVAWLCLQELKLGPEAFSCFANLQTLCGRLTVTCFSCSVIVLCRCCSFSCGKNVRCSNDWSGSVVQLPGNGCFLSMEVIVHKDAY